ncbi:DUF1176 domain-containing protein [Massilia dura]|uniref:DUF1176 domain-containing protein n=1 Tax=Pseudoduganella dura TaxID=321982 RepID=A0A6I3XQ41_9BURK|nr:DUF1176 domain-containing protein [Pseudoduganella dura]MUI15931.1 DUF1176 domain-containing protein [Pseudoduganella dura]GGX94670.1 hypothetical protein GCM10007386_26950 [Pseudoduganella dura]
MKISTLLRAAIPAAALFAPLVCAAQEYRSWNVQCDNVNRCEAVGYGPDRETARQIAVQLVREAGPDTAVMVKVILTGDGPREPDAVTITVGRHRPIPVRANRPMPREAARELLDMMIDGRTGRASDGAQQLTLPLDGMKAALLRMDAVQGRIGTPGALVRRGRRPEASVPPAPAMPVLHAAPRAQRVEDIELIKAVSAEAGLDAAEGIDKHSLYRFADDRLLLLFESARGSYRSFFEAWLANGRPPYQPRRLSLPNIGPEEGFLESASFNGQVLESYYRGTYSDCLETIEWLWTGNKFELLTMYRADSCRGMTGLIEHRKWVARKAPAN